MDYISREDAFNAMSATNLISNLDSVITDDAHRYHRAAERIIASIPSADVVERKTGTWRHYENNLTCSECGDVFYDDIMDYCGDKVPHYCPNCGAKMEGNE